MASAKERAHRAKALVDEEVLQAAHGRAWREGLTQCLRQRVVRQHLVMEAEESGDEEERCASEGLQRMRGVKALRALASSARVATVSCFSLSSCCGDSGGRLAAAAAQRCVSASGRGVRARGACAQPARTCVVGQRAEGEQPQQLQRGRKLRARKLRRAPSAERALLLGQDGTDCPAARAARAPRARSACPAAPRTQTGPARRWRRR